MGSSSGRLSAYVVFGYRVFFVAVGDGGGKSAVVPGFFEHAGGFAHFGRPPHAVALHAARHRARDLGPIHAGIGGRQTRQHGRHHAGGVGRGIEIDHDRLEAFDHDRTAKFGGRGNADAVGDRVDLHAEPIEACGKGGSIGTARKDRYGNAGASDRRHHSELDEAGARSGDRCGNRRFGGGRNGIEIDIDLRSRKGARALARGFDGGIRRDGRNHNIRTTAGIRPIACDAHMRIDRDRF